VQGIHHHPLTLVGKCLGVPRIGIPQGGRASRAAVILREHAGNLRIGNIDHRNQPRRLEQAKAALIGDFAAEPIVLPDDVRGPEVIDVSNPASAQRVGGYDTSGSAVGVAESGNFALCRG
jgi:hypothetical protein